MQQRNVKFLEIPSELGAGKRGASLGPAAVRLQDAERGGTIYRRFPHEVLYHKNSALHTSPKYPMARYINTLYNVYQRNCELIEFELEEGYFPIIMTGDHSNAIAGISALVNANPDKKIGVIWIDAHGDLNTPYTTPSGNIHGMPLGAMLGEGYSSKSINDVPPEVEELWTKITAIGSRNIAPKIHPADLVFIDIRDLEDQEWQDIEDNHIKYFVPARLHNMDMNEVGGYVLDYLDKCDYIYCSFDVDSMDPSVSPGTGTSVENGLSLQQAIDLLKAIWNSPKLKMLEITEINPLLDNQNQMARSVLEILDALLPEQK